MTGPRWVTSSYLALLGWQPVWLLALPPPAGPRNLTLALLATAPLLLPLAGVLRGRLRTMTWAGFLALPYFIIGVTEAWSSPDMRLAALVEAMLAAAYPVLLARSARGKRPSGRTDG